MHVGDLVISRIRRQNLGSYKETRILQEVLAVDPTGYPTHSCTVGNPENETPTSSNSKGFQHIEDYVGLSKAETAVIKMFPDFDLARKPLDEPASVNQSITWLEFIRLLAEIFGKDAP